MVSIAGSTMLAMTVYGFLDTVFNLFRRWVAFRFAEVCSERPLK